MCLKKISLKNLCFRLCQVTFCNLEFSSDPAFWQQEYFVKIAAIQICVLQVPDYIPSTRFDFVLYREDVWHEFLRYGRRGSPQAFQEPVSLLLCLYAPRGPQWESRARRWGFSSNSTYAGCSYHLISFMMTLLCFRQNYHASFSAGPADTSEHCVST